MVTIHIYSRDDTGLIRCHTEAWEAAEDAVSYYANLADMDPSDGQPEALMGWPTAGVRWYGPVGVGE